MSLVLTQNVTKTICNITNNSGTHMLVLLASCPEKDGLTIQLYDIADNLNTVVSGQDMIEQGNTTVQIPDLQELIRYNSNRPESFSRKIEQRKQNQIKEKFKSDIENLIDGFNNEENKEAHLSELDKKNHEVDTISHLTED